MEQDKFITKVNEPTEWVTSMAVSVRNGKIRICLDPKDLNKAIKREHHPMKSIEEIVREIPNAIVFSKLDAKSGIMQIQLDEDSSKLTTFNTPLGRYRWLRFPFGLKCSPEIFQRIMD
ncbi:Reverse transcriptases (RTs) from retrotransposons domain-containing protein [Elysia marginata]|uniref:Reverse transcriptases (RTs) from retrotransposons domain-containing protein n=1 Tax=Elysia marginata TaxID=1093978 RepID=A0AAV4EAY0_9GAST|nr:Reverse transcriptases (RTs) from retrotransposons domain-containing protein [Elysia marginata]